MSTAKPRALVIAGDGINCELETAQAFRLAGFEAEPRHLNDLIAERMTQDTLSNEANGLEPGFETILRTLVDRTPGTGFLRDDAMLVVLVMGNGNVANFNRALQTAILSCWPIVVMYHLYGGVAGLLQFTTLGGTVGGLLATVATRHTFPFFTALISTVVACLVPSSGGIVDVSVDGQLGFSKKKLRRHAEPGEVSAAICT